jgi:7,8-dihydropterin-6-yl-methyl-4-(beta-D-ribofuranosyl)aminobenzene 5'-phosphate synthase
MKTNRRLFIKTLVGASMACIPNTMYNFAPNEAQAAEQPVNFGEVRRMTITCVSEVGWFDTEVIYNDVSNAGGMSTCQYDIPFTADNAGGFSALLTIEDLEGKETCYLLDTGWSTGWMDHAFHKSGIDDRLKNREIQGLIISHDHNDHFWGVESTLKHCPDIPLYHPSTIHEKSFRLLDGADFSSLSGNPRNRFAHTGQRIPVYPGELRVFQPGVAISMFDMHIPLGVRGENVVYVNVKDKGYVIITGCGHPGIEALINCAASNFAGGDRIYGCYGGLHIAPFEKWDPQMQNAIDRIKNSGMRKVACNHCTGRVWVDKAMGQGIPIVHGTDLFRTYDRVAKNDPGTGENLYIGNGDIVCF